MSGWNLSHSLYEIAGLVVLLLIVIVGSMVFYGKKRYEGFTTIALESQTMPKCFLRDADAQALVQEFVQSPNADAFAELRLILQKVLCMDADITGAGAGVYSTYQLPFATAHDIEPAASFVNRCVKGAVRSRDLEMVIDKFEGRGSQLIQSLAQTPAQKQSAMDRFNRILKRASGAMKKNCIVEKASMDIPAGRRDPGYFEPDFVGEQGAYQITGGRQYF